MSLKDVPINNLSDFFNSPEIKKLEEEAAKQSDLSINFLSNVVIGVKTIVDGAFYVVSKLENELKERESLSSELPPNLQLQEILFDQLKQKYKNEYEIGNYQELISQSSSRIIEKLNQIDPEKSPHLLLGLEYIVDQLIEKKIKKRQVRVDDEQVELADLFDTEAIYNIENSFSR